MNRQHNYYIYIMASKTGTLYIGVTNDMRRRVHEHKSNIIKGFTQKYSCHKLVYFEQYNDVNQAISREKQIKNWARKKKEFLIKKVNPSWKDLSLNWE